MVPLLTWLIQGAVGPALVGLPVTWAATDLAGAAKRWFRRLRHSDGLSRIVRAAAGSDIDLSDAELVAVQRLVERESTWALVGRGTVEDLAIWIASCLPNRSAGASITAGRAIAAGLLEFAIRDLEPEWFQRVLFARLDRLETCQGRALDEAMFSMHADLAVLLAHQETDEDRFTRVMGQLDAALDRLPPAPADQTEVMVYLATLIRWLNTDPWPQRFQPAEPALTPATLERRLWVTEGGGGKGEQSLDADELARRCARLVVLGGPGSGKTWLARRTARRCAEVALAELAAGALPDEVELPLYTTCARLAAAPPTDRIRRAVVASALSQLPDLGGSHVTDALHVLFEKRDGAPTLLVIDSLDEARGAEDRIRLADTLPVAWRIVLTSRPGSWNGQLAIGKDDESRRVGTLRPLRYPEDVESFIAAWFSGRPARGADLATQIRNRRSLQRAVTVPLVLAFYCIIGGDQPLPARSGELYQRVIKRMLTGRWRGGDREPDWDPEACMETLRDWAWSAATSNPASGVGEWPDEFTTHRVKSRDNRDALDHVAIPLGPPDPDTGMTRRRFVHRSIQEHLVAEHVALRMSAKEAASELLKHLWYDPDWQHTAPAALAMHPEHKQVLNDLICRVTGGGQLGADVSAIDGCWEIRRFLARVARESSEDDWSDEEAELIGQARTDLVTPNLGTLQLVAANDWPTSNHTIFERLLGWFVREAGLWEALTLAKALSKLDLASADRAAARQELLAWLAGEARPDVASELAEMVIRLAVSPGDQAAARRELLGLLAGESRPWMARRLAEVIARLDPAAEDRAAARQMLLALLARDTRMAQNLGGAVTPLTPTPEERAVAGQALLALLSFESRPGRVRRLAKTIARLDLEPGDRAAASRVLLALLSHETDSQKALVLVDALVQLDPAAEERAAAREVLLAHLIRKTRMAQKLGEAVTLLTPTPEERAATRQALVTLLTRGARLGAAGPLAETVAALDPAPEEQAAARCALLPMLARKTNPETARVLAKAIARLDPAPEERAAARQALLALVTYETDRQRALDLTDALSGLDPAPDERAAVRQALLALLTQLTTHETDDWTTYLATSLADAIARLDPAPDERAAVRQALLALLTQLTTHKANYWISYLATSLADAIIRLDPAPEDRAAARQALLALRAYRSSKETARIVKAVAWFVVTPEERVKTTQALLANLNQETRPEMVGELAEAVVRLAVMPQLRAMATQALLANLTDQADSQTSRLLTEAVTQLAATPEERMKVTQALLSLLTQQDRPSLVMQQLGYAVTRLAVTPEERVKTTQALLANLTHQADPETAQVLAEAVTRLAVVGEDRSRATRALITLLANETRPGTPRKLADAVAGLDPAPEDRTTTRQALLARITGKSDPETTWALAKAIVRFDPAPEERAAARQALLALLTSETDPGMARALAEAVAGLDPTTEELASAWQALLALLARKTVRLPRPTTDLFIDARRNSGLSAWLAALPLLSRDLYSLIREDNRDLQ